MDRAQANAFIDTLCSGVPRGGKPLFIQLKGISPNPEAKPLIRSFVLGARRQLLDTAERWNQHGYNIFMSVNPRVAWGGKKVDVEGVVALPFDYDIMALALAAGDTLCRLGLTPGLAVRSGRGGHLYLPLDRFEPRVEEAQAIGRRICRFTGSDPVHARNQVMRLPGTMNWKPQVAGTEARLTWCEPRYRYSLEAITARLDAAGVPVPDLSPKRRSPSPSAPSLSLTAARSLISTVPGAPRDGVALTQDDLNEEESERQVQLLTFLPEEYQRIANEGAPRGQRSEAAMGLCRLLINLRASEDEIEIFFRLRPSGIGEVVVEKGLPWLAHTLDALGGEPDLVSTPSPAVSTVRLKSVTERMYWDRAGLYLIVEAGPFSGEHLQGALDLKNPRARDPWRFCFMSFGQAPAPFGDVAALQRLVGYCGSAVLVRDNFGLKVKRWTPSGLAVASRPPPLCT